MQSTIAGSRLGAWFRQYHLALLGFLLAGLYLFGLPQALRGVHGPYDQAERLLLALRHPEAVLWRWHLFGALSGLLFLAALWEAHRHGRWAVLEAGLPLWVYLLTVSLLVRLVGPPLDWLLPAVIIGSTLMLCCENASTRLCRFPLARRLRPAAWAGDLWLARHPLAALLGGGVAFTLCTGIIPEVSWLKVTADSPLARWQAETIALGLGAASSGAVFAGVIGVMGAPKPRQRAWGPASA